MKFPVQPIESRADIIHFPAAVVVLARAQSGAAKVEAQHRETKTVQRLHGVKDDSVVQRSAVNRMRMAHQSRMGGIFRAPIEQSLQSPGGAVEKERFDVGMGGRHGKQITPSAAWVILSTMDVSPLDVVAFTRQLVDIESITGNEGPVGDFLHRELRRLGYQARKMQVEGERCNVYATWPEQAQPAVVLSTHMDTVPLFIPSSEDATRIYGRGSCDAKGIIATQIAAAERLRQEGIHVGLLFLVGEERDSQGAKVANQQSPGCKFLVNGEPTENQIAVASKGTLRVEVTAQGRMAHSAYPELGESAIDKLIEALSRLRAMKLPVAEGIGPCTLNIGLIEGGRAPNVIPDHAKAHLLYRLVGPTEQLRREIEHTVGNLAKVEFSLEIPFMRLRSLDGVPTMVAAFTTDIPALGNWGEPLLVGPGSIHVAHTEGEYVEKKQLSEAAELYCTIAKKLLT
jgi:acetylornithine deacetylase